MMLVMGNYDANALGRSSNSSIYGRCFGVGKCIKNKKYGAECGPRKKETTSYCQVTGNKSATDNSKITVSDTSEVLCSGNASCRMSGYQEQYIGTCQGCGTPPKYGSYDNGTCALSCQSGYTKVLPSDILAFKEVSPYCIIAGGSLYCSSDWSSYHSKYGNSTKCCKVINYGMMISAWDCGD